MRGRKLCLAGLALAAAAGSSPAVATPLRLASAADATLSVRVASTAGFGLDTRTFDVSTRMSGSLSLDPSGAALALVITGGEPFTLSLEAGITFVLDAVSLEYPGPGRPPSPIDAGGVVFPAARVVTTGRVYINGTPLATALAVGSGCPEIGSPSGPACLVTGERPARPFVDSFRPTRKQVALTQVGSTVAILEPSSPPGGSLGYYGLDRFEIYLSGLSLVVDMQLSSGRLVFAPEPEIGALLGAALIAAGLGAVTRRINRSRARLRSR